MELPNTRDEKIGIIGSGLIGRSWAMLFASRGYDVVIYDIIGDQLQAALDDIGNQLEELEEHGLIRGSLSAEEQRQRVRVSSDFSECVRGAKFVQECVPEDMALKKKVFAQIDELAGDDAILSSSTSSLVPSLFTADLKHRENAIVSHPTNPPYYCPLVEVVPAPWTKPEVVTRTVEIMREIGQVPVTLKKEIDGFVLNRMQYSLLGECWRLVMNDIISAEDIDKVMSHGLGMRYAFIGPLETCHLNADGTNSYCDRYADMIYRVQQSFGEPIPMTGEARAKIHEELSNIVPEDQVAEKRAWRDVRLASLARMKKDLDEVEAIKRHRKSLDLGSIKAASIM